MELIDNKNKTLRDDLSSEIHKDSKLGKDENVTTDVLIRICEALKCDTSDIMEIVEDATD